MPQNDISSTEHKPIKELTSKFGEKLLWTKLLISLITGIASSLVATVPIFLQKVGWGQVKTFLATFGWFIALLLLFQLLIVAFTLLMRKRQQNLLNLRREVIQSYLAAIDESTLNPKPTTRGLLVE